MPNLATILKQEIVRLARKEVRAEVQLLRKTGAQSRTDIAALKRRVAALEKQLVRLGKAAVAKKADSVQQATTGVRFSAKGFAALRRRLDLSASDMGLLLGVSDQSVYKWERGVRPRVQQLPQIAALRKLSKRQATDLLASRQP